MPTENNLQILYNTVNSKFPENNLGTLGEFSEKMKNPDNRQIFYNTMINKFPINNLGTYQQFESKIMFDISPLEFTRQSIERIEKEEPEKSFKLNYGAFGRQYPVEMVTPEYSQKLAQENFGKFQQSLLNILPRNIDIESRTGKYAYGAIKGLYDSAILVGTDPGNLALMIATGSLSKTAPALSRVASGVFAILMGREIPREIMNTIEGWENAGQDPETATYNTVKALFTTGFAAMAGKHALFPKAPKLTSGEITEIEKVVKPEIKPKTPVEKPEERISLAEETKELPTVEELAKKEKPAVKEKVKPAEIKFTEAEKDIFSFAEGRLSISDIVPGGLIREGPMQGTVIGAYGRKSYFPDWFKNKGYTRKQIYKIGTKIDKGKKLTTREQEIARDIINSAKGEYESFKYRDEITEREKIKKEKTEEERLKKAEEEFYKPETEKASEGMEVLAKDQLNKGDKFTIEGEKYEVTAKTRYRAVLKDGKPYVLGEGGIIEIDKGSLNRGGTELKEKAPESELALFPEKERPYQTTTMLDVKDFQTGKDIPSGSSVWYYPERGYATSETHKKLFQQIQKTGKLFEEKEFKFKPEETEAEKKQIKVGEEQKSLTKQVKEKIPPKSERLYSGFPFPSKIRTVLDKMQDVLQKEPEGLEGKAWDMFYNYYETKVGLRFSWDKKIQDLLETRVPSGKKTLITRRAKLKPEFTEQNLEDAMFYRQRTGNRFISKEDTFEDVSRRTPDKLKTIVDGGIDEHIRNVRKVYNDSPWTKDIVAREEIAEIYLTGVYAGKIKGKNAYEYLVGLKGKSFVTNNFMRNRKTYNTFAEAFDKAGYVPRFRSLADQLRYQNAYLTRLLANNELIGKIYTLEKETGQKLIIRPTNKKLYNAARKDVKNYVPYDDAYLRSYVAGKKADGSLAWATHQAPALVNRELSNVIQSVFKKESYKPETIFGQSWDLISAYLRYLHISISAWHLGPLGESYIGGGFKNIFRPISTIRRNRALLKNEEFMTDALGAGVQINFEGVKEISKRRIESDINRLTNKLATQGKFKKVMGRTITGIFLPQKKITDLIFKTTLPTFKAGMYYKYLKETLDARIKKLKKERKPTDISVKELNNIRRACAKIVNDQFGVQTWELIRYMNDPKVMKWAVRLFQYPDWGISALRQAFGALGTGVGGRIARRYWLRYGIMYFTFQNAMSYLNTGFYNDEEGNIKWSWDKAHSTFDNEDPTHKFDYQLPDVEVDILGYKFNPGREKRADGTYGRLYFSHIGKQMLEIPRYATDTFQQLFSKSNPILQIIGTQAFGGKPYKGGIFPARGAYVYGQFESWGGKKGFEQIEERAKQILEDISPYQISSARQGKWIGMGMTPISKGMSTFAAREEFYDAMKSKDTERVSKIIASLRAGNYNESQIKRAYTIALNRLTREQEERGIITKQSKPNKSKLKAIIK